MPRNAIGAVMVVALLATACTAAGGSSAERIAQPARSELGKSVQRRLAPDSARVDLRMPSFSNPTRVTNPLFPIGKLLSVVIRGEVDGKPLKIETTLLPQTKTIVWNGRSIEALQSQFLAFLEGRITESAVDFYAQSDDGAVWYFGEDVADYDGSRATTTEGTWVVGVDGPAAMIMPAHPKVGDVYRTENVPGVAFEEVTVKRTGVTVTGPSGPVSGAMIGQELHMEGDLEAKTFAPGYGEFFSGGGHDYEANALTVPADASSDPMPRALGRLTAAATAAFDAARSNHWADASSRLDEVKSSWKAVIAPGRLRTHMNGSIAALGKALAAHDASGSIGWAFDVGQTALDLQLQYRSVPQVNFARLALWAGRLGADAQMNDADHVHGDITTLEFIRDRLTGVLDATDMAEIDARLRYLTVATEAGELDVVRQDAPRLRSLIEDLAAAKRS